jgi:8-oxo-dGTP pyrophosphatase MutT (NUDIX family)
MEAAVAIIRSKKPDPRILILRRALNPLDPWSGHFAFPGGRRESIDADLLATCLRETREECGLRLSPAALKKELAPTEAGNALGKPVRVVPFLFEVAEPLPLHLDPAECAAAYWVPESHLRDPALRGFISPLPDPQKRFPSILLEGGHIWGFTYKVLENLLKSEQA